METLQSEGLDVGLINARFVKPLDHDVIASALQQDRFLLTVEEGCLMGGFGSAVLESAVDRGLDTSRMMRLGLPDQFVEHGDREELLAELLLDAEGIAATCRRLARRELPLHDATQNAVR
jgi:1-deoxy-D-xylulose-5-phosphate synthase